MSKLFSYRKQFGAIIFCNCVAATNLVAETSINIDTPASGWQPRSDKNVAYTQAVNYPASFVSANANQAETARIKGSIAEHTKNSSTPATLVVNGVAMPMRIDDEGKFDRPYTFPAGSNGVEVRHPDIASSRRVQFWHTADGQSAAVIRVVLSWDTDNTDLDLHVITPDGGHAWYGERVLGNGGAIDVDVTTGYGPEIFSSPAPLQGQYLIYVNYYGGGYREGEANQLLTTASITIITQEGTINEKQENVFIPMRKPGELTFVKSFSYP